MFFLGLQKKCFLSLLKGVFQKEFTNLQFLRRLLHLYIMSIQKHNFFFTVNLTFVKTSCTFSRLYSLFMFNTRAKVYEFVITKIHVFSVLIECNAFKNIRLEFLIRYVTQILLLGFDNY